MSEKSKFWTHLSPAKTNVEEQKNAAHVKGCKWFTKWTIKQMAEQIKVELKKHCGMCFVWNILC